MITRKGRAVLDKLGMTPSTMKNVVKISLETRNTDGASPAAFKEAIKFLEEEMKDEHGIDIKIPVDVVGAKYFYVPPSGDVLVNPKATTGVAKVFYELGLQDKWTMSSSCFDGANYGLFTGDDVSMKADNKAYVEEARRLGCKVLFMGECGHAYRVMKMMMEPGKWWGDLPFEIIMNVSGKRKVEQIRASGAKYVAAACSNCKRQLTQLMEYYKEDIAVGGVHDMLSRSILINGKAAERTEY